MTEKSELWTRALFGTMFAFGAVWIVWDALQAPRYTVDGWCLTHERGAVEFANPTAALQSAIPIFRVPYDDPKRSVTVSESESGLAISYYKLEGQPFENFQSSTESWGGSYWGECPRTPLENGLSRIESVVSEHCIEWIEGDTFIPTEKYQGFGQISIYCLPDEANASCRMSVVLQNNWEATVLLRKEQLDDWRTAANRSRDFFLANLTDCGE
jgi:hypothetical protein